MAKYMLSAAMRELCPFQCYVCGKEMIADIRNDKQNLMLFCVRCKAKVTIERPACRQIDAEVCETISKE